MVGVTSIWRRVLALERLRHEVHCLYSVWDTAFWFSREGKIVSWDGEWHDELSSSEHVCLSVPGPPFLPLLSLLSSLHDWKRVAQLSLNSACSPKRPCVFSLLLQNAECEAYCCHCVWYTCKYVYNYLFHVQKYATCLKVNSYNKINPVRIRHPCCQCRHTNLCRLLLYSLL